jgi:hypothetical protein
LQGQETHLRPSDNPYDWLGTGIYFWEANPLRALQFAQERAQVGKNSRGPIQNPFVLVLSSTRDECSTWRIPGRFFKSRMRTSLWWKRPA